MSDKVKRDANIASGKLPDLDINKIIDLIVAVAQKKKSPKEAAKEIAVPYIAFAKVFAENNAKEYLEMGLDKAGLDSLSDTDFSAKLIECSKRIGILIYQYMTNKIDVAELITGIGGTELKDIFIQTIHALGIHEKLGVANMDEVFALSPVVLAYTASLAAYKELKKAEADLTVARERRKQIEASCAESISRIRMYRAKMDKVVSEYLTDHLETFESGFAAMDRAIIENDVDGYILGNVEIQEILNYDMQFTNYQEFNDLMESDSAFKL